MLEATVVEIAAGLRARREPHVIATVVRVRGSAYRRPGARMLVSRDGWLAGSVSGGCLEDDLVKKAWWYTERGPVIRSYDSSVPDDASPDEVRLAFGTGCGGVVDVLLERYDPRATIDPLALAADCRRDQRRHVIATALHAERDAVPVGARFAIVDGRLRATHPLDAVERPVGAVLETALAHGRSEHAVVATEHGTLQLWVEVLRPPPCVFVFGGGHDVAPLAHLGRALGWDVVVCSRRPRRTSLESVLPAASVIHQPPAALRAHVKVADRALAVVMNHSLDADRESLSMLLDTDVPYIGVLGSRARTRRLLEEVGFAHDDPRIHTPVGLALGAETPSEIALSIVAEMQATLAEGPR